MARAPADGYTFMVTTDSTLTINPHLYAKLPYDPVKDFTPITQLVRPNQSGRQSVVTFVANGDRWTYQPSCDAQGGH